MVNVSWKCRYLFIFSIDVHFLGADGFADVLDVIFSAVIKYVFVLFPGRHRDMKGEMLMVTSSKRIRFCAWTSYIVIFKVPFFLSKLNKTKEITHFWRHTKRNPVTRESLFIKDMTDNAIVGPPQAVVTRATSLGNCSTGHPHAAASFHLWLYLLQITAWHWGQKWALGEEGWRAGGSGGGGVGLLGEGEKRGKISFRALRLPSLSTIQINWIYVAIVRLKPGTPAVLPCRKSVALKAQTSTSCLPVWA